MTVLLIIPVGMLLNKLMPHGKVERKMNRLKVTLLFYLMCILVAKFFGTLVLWIVFEVAYHRRRQLLRRLSIMMVQQNPSPSVDGSRV